MEVVMPKKSSFNFWQRDVSLPEDPCTLQEEGIRDSQTGQNALAPPKAYGEKGTIKEVFPATHTYTVETERSGILHGRQRLLQSPNDNTLLPAGTRVAISHAYGEAVIAGVLIPGTPVTGETTPTSLTGVAGRGADDPLYKDPGSANFRPAGVPRDLSPNDQATIGPSGNAMGVLDGGVNIMKSTDFSQIRTHLINDVVEIISRRFRHITAMGFSEYKDEGGRTSFVFRGGSDQTTECGSDQENWTIRFDLGNAGDLFKLELTQPDGAAVFRVHVTPDGKAELFAAKGFDYGSGGDKTEKVLGDETTDVKGSVDRTVRGKETHTVHGERVVTVAANDSRTAGNDSTESVIRHYTKSVGGDAKYSFVGGGPATALPTNEALSFEIVNGSWKVNIGDPISMASPAALAGFELNTFMGDIYLGVKTKGNVTLETLLGDGIFNATNIQLGGSMGKEPFVCGDLLMSLLGELVDAIMKMTVPTPVGPSGPPINMPAFTAVLGKIKGGYPLSQFITGQQIRTPF